MRRWRHREVSAVASRILARKGQSWRWGLGLPAERAALSGSVSAPLLQDPGEHGWQHREALLQRRHLPAADRRGRGAVQTHPHRDLRAPRPTTPSELREAVTWAFGLASRRFPGRPPSKRGWMSVEGGFLSSWRWRCVWLGNSIDCIALAFFRWQRKHVPRCLNFLI